MRLVIGRLEEFANRVSEGLDGTDWSTRRDIIRALVKRVEVDENEAQLVYRVSPSPFEDRSQQGLLQHCWGRSRCAFRPPGYPRRPEGGERGSRPAKQGGSSPRAVSRGGRPNAVSSAEHAPRGVTTRAAWTEGVFPQPCVPAQSSSAASRPVLSPNESSGAPMRSRIDR